MTLLWIHKNSDSDSDKERGCLRLLATSKVDQLANCHSALLGYLVPLPRQLSIGCIQTNVELIADFVSDLQLCYFAINRIVFVIY